MHIHTSIILIGVLVACTMSFAITIQLNPIADAYFYCGNNSNTGTVDILASEGDTASNYYGSWMKFDLSTLSGYSVQSAILKLTSTYYHGTSANYHAIYSASDDSWVETTVSGTNAPTGTYQYVSKSWIATTLATYSWDVKTAVVGSYGLSGSNQLLSLLIKPDVLSGEYYGPHFASRENTNTSIRPLLVLEIAPVPEPATFLLLCVSLLLCLVFKHNKRV